MLLGWYFLENENASENIVEVEVAGLGVVDKITAAMIIAESTRTCDHSGDRDTMSDGEERDEGDMDD